MNYKKAFWILVLTIVTITLSTIVVYTNETYLLFPMGVIFGVISALISQKL